MRDILVRLGEGAGGSLPILPQGTVVKQAGFATFPSHG